jgi:PAS domain S-box-containing protein
MAVAKSRLAALSDVTALLEVLQGDDRPTFILEQRLESTPEIVFRNASLDTLIHHATHMSAFETWAAIAWEYSLTGSQFFCDREWSSRPFRDAWTIVFCHPSCTTPRSASTIALQFPTSQSISSTSSHTIFGPSQLPTPLTPSTPLSPLSIPIPQRRLADWTLADATSPWFHFVKHFPWSNTPFGDIQTWSLELRRSTAKIMNSPDPRILIYGDERAIIYNEAFAAVIGQHHPHCLGIPLADAKVGRVFEILQHMSLVAYDNGKGAQLTHQELLVERDGSQEQTFWSIFLSPLPGTDGYCDSVVGEFTDVTDLVVQDQHRSQGLDIFDSISKVENLPELWCNFLSALDHNVPDVSYAMIYTALGHASSIRSADLPTPDITPHYASLQSATSYFVKQYQLVHSLGISSNAPGHVIDIAIAEDSDTRSLADAFREALERKEIITLSDKALPQELSLQEPGSESVGSASILPISNLNGKPLAFIVLGLDPKRPLNESMSRFIRHIHGLITKQAILVSLPKEQQDFQKKYEETTMALSHQLRLSISISKKKEEKFLRIAKSAPLGMYLCSPKQKTIQVNDAYLKITRTTQEDLHIDSALELPWLRTVSEEHMDVALKEWQRLMTEKTPSAIEYKIRDPCDDTDPRWVSATSFPELDEHGDVYMIHGWIVDISDRLAKENLLAQRLEDALETKTATEHFLDSTYAH